MKDRTKPPSRRAQELAEAMLAGYENDLFAFGQLLVRRQATSPADMNSAWERGQNARRDKEPAR